MLSDSQNAPAQTSGDSSLPPAPPISRLAIAALLVAVAAGLLAPIWTVRYVPLVDYPNHLASAYVLAHLHDPQFHFRQFYRADWNTYPYLAMDVILLALQHLFSIDTAGRLLLSLCVLSVPAAAWFFIHLANRGEEHLALWALLVANNLYFFLWGFLNLQLSLALMFVLLGLWLWHLERASLATWLLLLAVTTALYFTHVMGFAVAAVAMTAYGWGARRKWQEMLAAWALYLPGAVCYLHVVLGHAGQGGWQVRSIPDKFGSLVSLVVGCSTPVDLLTLVVLLIVLPWAQIDNREFHWNRPWPRVAAILFAFYWILPAAYGPATNIDKRILPFVFVLSLAGAKVGPRARKLALVALALFVVRAGTLERHALTVQPHLAKLAASFVAIPPNARVLPLVDWAGGAPLPERHFWAYGVISRGWLAPCLFHDPGVHPFSLKAGAYAPCTQEFTSASSVDLARLKNQFDFVWAYHVPQLSTALSSVGSKVIADDEVQIYRVNH